MAKFYCERINHDINRLNEVPKYWRATVKAIIENNQG